MAQTGCAEFNPPTRNIVGFIFGQTQTGFRTVVKHRLVKRYAPDSIIGRRGSLKSPAKPTGFQIVAPKSGTFVHAYVDILTVSKKSIRRRIYCWRTVGIRLANMAGFS